MANQFEVSVDVGVSADTAWKVAGDPANIGWFPPVAACEVRGNTRYVALTNGQNLVEELLERDDAGRSYSYSVREGASTAMHSHCAWIRVEEIDGGSRIIWRTEADPEDPDVDLEERLSGVMGKGLAELKRQLEIDAE